MKNIDTVDTVDSGRQNQYLIFPKLFHGFMQKTDPLFLQFCILKVKEIYFYSLGLLMFKYNLSLLPSMFQEIAYATQDLKSWYPYYTYATRQTMYFHVRACRANISKMSLRYPGSVFWNKLLMCIDIDCSIGTFKRRVKAYLMNNPQTRSIVSAEHITC